VSSFGSRKTCEPLDPYCFRFSAPFVENVFQKRSKSSNFDVARITSISFRRKCPPAQYPPRRRLCQWRAPNWAAASNRPSATRRSPDDADARGSSRVNASTIAELARTTDEEAQQLVDARTSDEEAFEGWIKQNYDLAPGDLDDEQRDALYAEYLDDDESGPGEDGDDEWSADDEAKLEQWLEDQGMDLEGLDSLDDPDYDEIMAEFSEQQAGDEDDWE
jgi:hypothetical protein